MTKKFTRNDDDDEMFFSPMKGPLGFTVNTRQMLEGKEFYFDAEQLRERLNRRMEVMEAEFNALQNPEPQPKKPSRKKKESTQA